MKEIGKMKSYNIGPDHLNIGDHVCWITLEIRTGPGALPELACSCVDLIGQEIGINLTRLQERISLVIGEE